MCTTVIDEKRAISNLYEKYLSEDVFHRKFSMTLVIPCRSDNILRYIKFHPLFVKHNRRKLMKIMTILSNLCQIWSCQSNCYISFLNARLFLFRNGHSICNLNFAFSRCALLFYWEGTRCCRASFQRVLRFYLFFFPQNVTPSALRANFLEDEENS